MFSSQPTTQPPQNAVALAWDPKNPAALLLPVTGGSPPSAPAEGEKIAAMQINTMLSHTGIGCNEHEIVALMQLLEKHEDHANLKPTARSSWNNIKTLSKAYRGALRECLCRWEDNLVDIEGNTNDSSHQDLSEENLELLKLVYALTHLSEIFLLSPPAGEIALDFYEDTFHVPGALTADTVRYLRHHHLPNPTQVIDPDVLQEITGSAHPDQIEGGVPYWDLVTKFVKRGLLEDAWALLSRHSAHRRALQVVSQQDVMSTLDDYEAKQLEQDKEGFEDLRRLLCSAPLPGGRVDLDDVGLDGPPPQPQQEEILLQGVEPSAYQMWETSRSTREGSDFPVTYNSRAASQKRQAWQSYVLELESVRRLKRRIPQLDGILAILSGNIKGVQFESWAEALVSEMIYFNPIILPTNIPVRAKKLMEKYPQVVGGEMDSVLLGIMQGNAGRVIEVLHAFGGGSGAALPATMTSLLCNLYVDAQIGLPESLQMDLLKGAAFAISSSLAGKNNDVGVRMVVRLLLPFATPKGDATVVATLGQTLERHTPSSDIEAKNLIALCRRLVEKKSVRILEGCVSLVLSRYRSYLKEGRPGGALHWLLLGMELEASLYAVEKDGTIRNWQKVEAMSVCHRYLVDSCSQVAGALLVGIMEEKEGLGLVYATAKAMVGSVKEGPMEGYATKLSEVRTLEYILGIYDGLTDTNDWTSVAKNITMCLQEESNEFDNGVVASVAPRNMHWNLLQLGHRVVDECEKRQATARMGEYSPSFDEKGVQVLLEQLTIIPLSREIEGMEPLPTELVQSMKLSFGKALSRAFVAENAKRKPKKSIEPDELFISKIRSCDLNKYDIRTQERVVKQMLGI